MFLWAIVISTVKGGVTVLGIVWHVTVGHSDLYSLSSWNLAAYHREYKFENTNKGRSELLTAVPAV